MAYNVSQIHGAGGSFDITMQCANECGVVRDGCAVLKEDDSPVSNDQWLVLGCYCWNGRHEVANNAPVRLQDDHFQERRKLIHGLLEDTFGFFKTHSRSTYV